MNLAVDRAGIVKIVFRGNAEPARGPITSAIKYNKYNETAPIKKDPAKAKELLKEAGFPNGFKGKLLIYRRHGRHATYRCCEKILWSIPIKFLKHGRWGPIAFC